MSLNQAQIQHSLAEAFDAGKFHFEDGSDLITLVVDKQVAYPLIKYMKETLGFEFLTDLCGVHDPDKELQLAVVYHLHNFLDNVRIRVKTHTSLEDPNIQSLTPLFSAANWMERETYDFFGIIFTDHPNLIRILNVEYLDYYPMRKEYPLEDQTRHDKDDRFFGR